MKLTRENSRVTVQRQKGDPRLKNESALWYAIRNVLRKEGEDVIKKEMSKDGHMVSDGIFYVRSRKTGKPGAFGIYDDRYQVRDSAEDYNKGEEVSLSLVDMSE